MSDFVNFCLHHGFGGLILLGLCLVALAIVVLGVLTLLLHAVGAAREGFARSWNRSDEDR